MAGNTLTTERKSWLSFLGQAGSDQPTEDAERVIAFHQRPGTPAGASFRDGVEYVRAGPTGRPLHLFLFGRTDSTERRPGVVFVHGGGWQEGHPYMHMRHAHDLAERGYVTAAIRYRLHPETGIEGALEDVRAAIRWMRVSHAEIGLDPQRLAIGGGSAGGHLAAFAALTAEGPEGQGDSGGSGDSGDSGDSDAMDSSVCAAFLWYPVTDLDVGCHQDLHDFVAGMCPNPGRRRALSPIEQVRHGAPPIVSITGGADVVTTLPMVEAFHRRLSDAGVPNHLEVFEGRGHAFDFAPEEWPGSFACFSRHLDAYLPVGGDPCRSYARRP